MNIKEQAISVMAQIVRAHAERHPDEMPRKVFHFDSVNTQEDLQDLKRKYGIDQQ